MRHSFREWMWLKWYMFLVRMGRDPLIKRNGKRRQFRRIGTKKVAAAGRLSHCEISNALRQKRFFIARLGWTEERVFGEFRQYQLGLLHSFPDSRRCEAQKNAGIFSNDDEGLSFFCDCLRASLNKVTHLGVLSCEFEPFLVRFCCNKQVKLFHYGALEHFRVSPSWMSQLRGQRVLVVSPFVETIKKQYERNELLFADPTANPVFKSLVLVQAEMTHGNQRPRFPDWKSTLYHMRDDCLAHDFDVAILSCGAYGIPLGAMLFDEGKNVIYAGGILQFYFGILGKRYEHPSYCEYINEHWTRPSVMERPEGYELIEDGVYW